MKRILHALLLSALGVSILAAEIKPPLQGNASLDPSPWVDPNAPRKLTEFTGENMDTVLRTLAREAKMNMVVSPMVKGNVNLRIENKTPREIIEIIVHSNGFIMEELHFVYYIRHPDEPLKSRAKVVAHDTRILFDALLEEKFTREEAMQLVIQLRANDKPAPAQKSERSSKPSSLTKR